MPQIRQMQVGNSAAYHILNKILLKYGEFITQDCRLCEYLKSYSICKLQC